MIAPHQDVLTMIYIVKKKKILQHNNKTNCFRYLKVCLNLIKIVCAMINTV